MVPNNRANDKEKSEFVPPQKSLTISAAFGFGVTSTLPQSLAQPYGCRAARTRHSDYPLGNVSIRDFVMNECRIREIYQMSLAPTAPRLLKANTISLLYAPGRFTSLYNVRKE
jgi:hypothetical protein